MSFALAPQPPAAPPSNKNPNPDGIEIRTKFPVARIKRIMQADEEVGKVAQVTPVAVSKARGKSGEGEGRKESHGGLFEESGGGE
ncbi:hypothetical protein QC760_002671 [Botrytis cinerea]